MVIDRGIVQGPRLSALEQSRVGFAELGLERRSARSDGSAVGSHLGGGCDHSREARSEDGGIEPTNLQAEQKQPQGGRSAFFPRLAGAPRRLGVGRNFRTHGVECAFARRLSRRVRQLEMHTSTRRRLAEKRAATNTQQGRKKRQSTRVRVHFWLMPEPAEAERQLSASNAVPHVSHPKAHWAACGGRCKRRWGGVESNTPAARL